MGHEDRGLMNKGLVPLLKELQKALSLLCHVRTQEEGGHL
jgi:hypothetical protein